MKSMSWGGVACEGVVYLVVLETFYITEFE
jgi:hypothetical protein